MNKNSNKTKEVFEDIINKLQAIVEKGDYEKFLKFQRDIRKYSLRRYSFGNLILIFSQFPEARKVAGKSQWLKAKREVLKGAQKIWIVAPIPRKYDKKVKKTVNEEEIEDIVSIEYNAYRWVYVYDISQTIGEEIPLQSRCIDAEDKAYFYEKLKKISHLPVLEQQLTGSIKGYYNEKNKEIVIKKTLSTNDKVAVLLHELSHALYDDFDYKKDRNLSEVFVESISYIVANHFQLDTSMCSFNYIIKWAKGEPKVIVELGNKIQKCANELIDKIEKFEMQELENVA